MSPTMASNPTSKSSSEDELLRERLLDEKMRLIRQRNEERMKRMKEIEEDIRNANSHSEEVSTSSPKQPSHRMSGVKTDEKPVSKFRGRARGRTLEKMTQEKPQAHRFKESQRTNYQLVEKELKEEKTSGVKKSSGFLADNQRANMSKVTGRSSHSWGGEQFENVVDKINKEQPRYKQEFNMDINMTGKERAQYHEWKKERSEIDQQRKSRQKRGNAWHREWDHNKIHKEGSSSGENKRSGQRFRERERRKPDWDHHDDRGEISFTESVPNTTRTQVRKEGEVSTNSSSENWDEIENTNCEQESSNSVLMTNKDVSAEKEEDWEEEIEKTDASVDKEDWTEVEASVIINNEQNTACHEREITEQESEDPHKEEQLHEDNPGLNNTEPVSQGEINKIDKSSEIKEQPSNNSILNETSNTNKEGNDIRYPKEVSIPTEIEEETKISNNPSKELYATTEELADTAKETNTSEESMSLKENASEADESKPIKEKDTAVTDTFTKGTKPKENLPKLDLTKTEEDPIPDFLKTPQYKDWAEYDFDEDELDFSSEIVFYP